MSVLSLKDQLKQRAALVEVKNADHAKTEKDSFLFDRREAAAIEASALHLLALDGIEQLKKLDPRFGSYQRILFGESSKSFKRMLVTKVESSEMDKHLESLLPLLSNFFLLKVTHQVLEYLIRIYMINRFNIDALMGMMLPYHETNIFVRMLRIIKIADTNWSFLAESSNTGTPPTRTFFARYAHKSRWFREFICETVKKYVQNGTSYQILHSFYGTLMVTSYTLFPVTSDRISDIAPYILSGVSVQDEDYQLSTCIILSALSSYPNLKLSAEFVTTLMVSLSKFPLPHRRQHAFTCLLLLLQNHPPPDLPEDSFKELMRWHDLPDIIHNATNAGNDVKPFLSFYLVNMAKYAPRNSLGLRHLITIIVKVKQSVKAVIADVVKNILLEAYPIWQELRGENVELVKKLFEVMEKDFGTQVDVGIDFVLNHFAMNKDIESQLMDSPMWNYLFKNTRHQLLAQDTISGAEITTIRKSLLLDAPPRYIKQSLELLSTSLAIMPDDNESNHTLKLLKKALGELLDPKTNKEVLLHILSMSSISLVPPEVMLNKSSILLEKVKQFDIRISLMKYLTGKFIEDHPNYTRNALPYLMKEVLSPNSKLSKKEGYWNYLGTIIGFVKKFSHPLFNKLNEIKVVPKDTSTYYQWVKEFVSTLGSNLGNLEKMNDDLYYVMNFQSDKTKEPHYGVKSLIYIIQNHSLLQSPAEKKLKLSLIITNQIIEDFVARKKPRTVPQNLLTSLPKATDNIHQIALLANQKVPYQIYSYSFSNILNSIPKQSLQGKNTFDSPNTRLLRLLYMFFSSSQEMLETFPAIFGQLFSVLDKQLPVFLSQIWMAPSEQPPVSIHHQESDHRFNVNIIKEELKYQTLVFFKGYLLELQHNAQLDNNLKKEIPTKIQQFFPWILVALVSSYQSTRGIGLECLDVLLTLFGGSTSTAPTEKPSIVPTIKKADGNAFIKNFIEILVEKKERLRNGDMKLANVFNAIFPGKDETSPENDNNIDSKKVGTAKDILSLQSYLITQILNFEQSHPKMLLIQAMSAINNPEKFQQTFNYLKENIPSAKSKEDSAKIKLSFDDSTLLALLLGQYHYHPKVLNTNNANFDFFLQTLTNQFYTLYRSDNDSKPATFSPQLVSVSLISPTFFSSLSLARQKQLFSVLCDLLFQSNHQVKELLRTRISKIKVKSEIIKQELSQAVTTIKNIVYSKHPPKKMKIEEKETTKSSGEAETEESVRVVPPKVTVILELFISTPGLLSHEYVGLLFTMLGLLNSDGCRSKDPSFEYTVQLILTNLTAITETIFVGDKQETDDKNNKIFITKQQHTALMNDYKISIIIDCFRSTNNPTIHNSCLLLLVPVAKLYPKAVLENIMSIFTFMGVSTRRSDDNYTFFVIQRSIEAVVPALLHSGMGVIPLVEVVVSNFYQIPSHRRILMFAVLSQTIGFKHFSITLALLMLKFVKEKSEEDPTTSSFNFLLNLCNKLPPDNLLHVIDALSTIFNSLTSPSTADSSLANYFKSHLTTPLLSLKMENYFLKFLGNFVSSPDYLNQLLVIPMMVEESIQKRYLVLFHGVLVYSQRKEDTENEEMKSLWKETQDLTIDIIGKLNDLLSIGNFIKEILMLLEHKDTRIQRQALTILNEKLENCEVKQSKLITSFVELSKQLLDILLKHDSTTDEESIRNSIVTRQTAALSIEILGRHFASHADSAQTFASLIPPLVGSLSSTNPLPAPILSSIMLALATLAVHLPRVKLLPHLNLLFPALLGVLRGTLTRDQNTLLRISSLSSVRVILTENSQFLTRFLPEIFQIVLDPRLLVTDNSNGRNSISSEVGDIMSVIAKAYGVESLVGPVGTVYEEIVANVQKEGPSGDRWSNSVIELVQFMGKISEAMTVEKVRLHHLAVFKVFLKVFDFSIECGFRIEKKEDVTSWFVKVQSAVIDNFRKFIMKLNEKLFKPLYLVILEWAQLDSLNESTVLDPKQLTKWIFFYDVVQLLASSLRSIFVPYFSYVISHSLNMIGRPPNSPSYCILHAKILKSLTLCFTNDTSNFVTADLFDKLLHPLINLLETIEDPAEQEKTAAPTEMDITESLTISTTSSEEDMQLALKGITRMKHFFVPCIVHLAVDLNNEALWKPLNYQLLLKTRSEKAIVRFSAVSAISALYSYLGEQFLPLLPESMQWISELLEDEDPRVENLTTQLVKSLEKLLGDDDTLRGLLK